MKKITLLLSALALSSQVFATPTAGDSTSISISSYSQAMQRQPSSGATNAQSRAIIVQQPQPIVTNYYVSNIAGPAGPQGPTGPAGSGSNGVQFSYQDFGGCGGVLYGPPNTVVNLQFDDASGCNANGGCNVLKALDSNGRLNTYTDGSGSGGHGYAFYNGRQIANWVTWTNCNSGG